MYRDMVKCIGNLRFRIAETIISGYALHTDYISPRKVYILMYLCTFDAACIWE